MHRRSFLQFLGIAPLAAPAIAAAARESATTVAACETTALPDGGSRFVVDASCFHITSSPHPLVWDDRTGALTVPALRLSRS